MRGPNRRLRIVGTPLTLVRGACHRAGHFGPDPLAHSTSPRARGEVIAPDFWNKQVGSVRFRALAHPTLSVLKLSSSVYVSSVFKEECGESLIEFQLQKGVVLHPS